MNDSDVQLYKSLSQDSFNFEFSAACRKNRLDDVRFILNHPILKEKVQLSDNAYECLNDAVYYGNLEIVKYLTSSPELKEHIDIQVNNNYPIRAACDNGYLEMVKYILTDQSLKNRPSIHVLEDLPFKLACESNKFNIISYLIFEQNIQKTDHISQYLENPSANPFLLEALSLFEKRDLTLQLEKDLASDKIRTKRIKL